MDPALADDLAAHGRALSAGATRAISSGATACDGAGEPAGYAWPRACHLESHFRCRYRVRANGASRAHPPSAGDRNGRRGAREVALSRRGSHVAWPHLRPHQVDARGWIAEFVSAAGTHGIPPELRLCG